MKGFIVRAFRPLDQSRIGVSNARDGDVRVRKGERRGCLLEEKGPCWLARARPSGQHLRSLIVVSPMEVYLQFLLGEHSNCHGKG